MKRKASHTRNSINCSSCHCGTAAGLLIPVFLAVACFALSATVEAVSPPPDGGYTNANTAEGQVALLHLDTTTGANNTAVGFASLGFLITGNLNTGVGSATLLFNTADSNTATGAGALLNNSTGSENTANGVFALSGNTTGGSNTAVGFEAMQNGTGSNVLFNTAVGIGALQATTANANAAVGDFALSLDSTGAFNTAIGAVAGSNQTTGSGNVYIGQGMQGVAGETNQTYIKNINTTSVSGAGTDFVTVNLTSGLLGHLSSSRRYKEEIKPMDNASETLYRLKPVTYHYKKEIDPTQSPAFGLIAEDVAEVNSALVARNAQGEIESVHYEWVNAMLLNEFLKEHKKVEEQEASIAELKSTVGVLTAQLKEQAAQIQKVSAQVEVNNPAPQVVVNKP
jgi:Chaperone of endosialidase